MDEIDREREQQILKRREGRKEGRLDRRLVEGIEACTPKQLKEVIRVARQNLKEYKQQAPMLQDIRLFRSSKLLANVPHKNKLYCMELHPCGKNCRKCPHGPYYIAYQRNGRYYPPKSQPNFSKLPKPVQNVFAPIRTELKRKTISK